MFWEKTQTKIQPTGIQTQGLSRWIPLWICQGGKDVVISESDMFRVGMF